MKVYMLAFTEGRHMYPVGSSPTIYKSRAGAQKALTAYHTKNPAGYKAKILCADNWHEEEVQEED